MADGQATDAELITRSQQQPTVFASVFDRHYDTVHRFLWSRVGDRAEDLTAEVFRIAFQQRDRYDPAYASARPWLFGIANRLIKQQYRQWARDDDTAARAAGEPTHGHEASPEQRLLELAPSSAVASALMRLPSRDREPLLLHVWDELRYDEIAHALDLPVGTVRSRIHRARRALRSALAGDEEADDAAGREGMHGMEGMEGMEGGVERG